MKVKNIILKAFIPCLSLLFITGISSGQTLNEAKEAFNNGVSAIQSNSLDEAILQFNKCMEIYSGLDEYDAMEAEDMIIQIESKLPTLHYQVAMDLYKAKKLDEAIVKFEQTSEVADKYGDESTAQKASKVVPQLYYMRAGNKKGENDLEGALADYNKAIELNPEYDKAYYMKSLICKNQDDEEGFIESTRKAIEIAGKRNSEAVLDKAKESGSTYFLMKGDEAKSAEKYSEAKKYLDLAIEFNNENPLAYYLCAFVDNQLKSYDNAIEAANNALAYEDNDPEKKARIYYELANALKEKGENDKACDAYKNATYGAYKDAAEYQIKYVLKCE
ncbi:MAG: tetratricopeptide repeat protein [Bacteroidales bacterium]|nr:MAG: tetratricopeptide repeat protein [Bacteroidales bacterium]